MTTTTPAARRILLDDGDTFTHRGYTFRVRFPHDDWHGAPWDEDDTHGIVSEWTTRTKAPGERILVRDGRSYRYYDVQASTKKAHAEGWGTADGQRPGEATGAYRARAVEADFDVLYGWANDHWYYVGVVVERLDEQTERASDERSIWGIESTAGAYLTETAYELAAELAGEADEAARVERAADYGFGV